MYICVMLGINKIFLFRFLVSVLGLDSRHVFDFVSLRFLVLILSVVFYCRF